MRGYTGKRVLITGGAGSIGSNLVAKLASEGAKVTVLDDLSVGHDWAVTGVALVVRGSVTDDADLERAFADFPDIVVHLAALYGNLNSLENDERDLEVNGLGTLKTLKHAKARGVKRFVFASSGCSVYGHDAPQPLREDLPPSLHYSSPYQVTKLLGELYCNLFTLHHGLPTVRCRFFSSYGPGETPGRLRGVVPNFVFWALRGEPLPITGTGEETRTFTYVGDLVDGIAAAGIAAGAEGEAFNLAGGEEHRIQDLADLVNRLAGSPAGVQYYARRPWDRIVHQAVDTSKARERLGYAPKTPLEEGIARTLDWMRANQERLAGEARF